MLWAVALRQEGDQAVHVFTGRLWAAYGVTCLLTLVVGALVFRDPIGVLLASLQVLPFLFTCFIGLTLLFFIPLPPLRNPALQVAVFLACLTLSGLTAALAGEALLPLFGQAAEFDLYPSYYLYSLPAFGLTLLAVALVHLARHPHRRRNRHQTTPLAD